MQASIFPELENQPKPYQVLARKYRPYDFEHLIGQEALINTFANAIKKQRIAHAFLLTGIRGVGKTTTARIMARALNCIGEDGSYNKPVFKPCGKCSHCLSISEDRHQDVLELDAASHTGVSDVREVIENVKYRPISARYKVYIIDEVHMLSNSAFNALLKTLEEPPEHTKFILATTEVRKIPATILSRCQRFDLKRVEVETLRDHFINISKIEGSDIEAKAAGLIANVAAGSVRDGLSILDQAIALSDGAVTHDLVASMLGLTDREARLNIFIDIAQGDVDKVLSAAKKLYNQGFDPVLLLQDMLEVVHVVTKAKILRNYLDNLYDLADTTKYKELAGKLTISFLNRAWQIISKGIDEVKYAYHPFAACEMVLIRLIYSNTLPSVEDLLNNKNPDKANNINPSGANVDSVSRDDSNKDIATQDINKVQTSLNSEFIFNLCLEHDEMMLHHHLVSDVVIIGVDNNEIKLKLKDGAPKSLPRQLQEFMKHATGKVWTITYGETNQPTHGEKLNAMESERKQKIINSPIVQDVLQTFTDLEIADINLIKN